MKAEKETLLHVEHPCLIKMHGAFQDSQCVYLVMEFVSGGEFFSHMKTRKRYNEVSNEDLPSSVLRSAERACSAGCFACCRLADEAAKFYAAQVLLAFEYLHRQNIIHRDLKVRMKLQPGWRKRCSCLVLDDNASPSPLLAGELAAHCGGNLKVTDFGFAKFVGPTKRTYTLCGTPDYLAPEVNN